jgi:hypothetical protein
MAALQQRLDAAPSEKATLAEELTARGAALAHRNSEYNERIEHQTATIEVLKAMSASPDDPQPVFELIATRARDVCGSYGVSVLEFDGSLIHLRAWNGISEDPKVREAYVARFPFPPTRKTTYGRVILDRQVAYIKDYLKEPGPVAKVVEIAGGVRRATCWRPPPPSAMPRRALPQRAG